MYDKDQRDLWGLRHPRDRTRSGKQKGREEPQGRNRRGREMERKGRRQWRERGRLSGLQLR